MPFPFFRHCLTSLRDWLALLSYKMCRAGDQAAEGLIGNIKKQHHRTNMTGRKTDAHVVALAAAWQLKHPGLVGVMKALKVYREGVQDKIPPLEVFVNRDWLGDVSVR